LDSGAFPRPQPLTLRKLTHGGLPPAAAQTANSGNQRTAIPG